MLRPILSSLLLILAACSAPPRPVEMELPLGFGDAWESFVDIADHSGYRTDPAATDRGLRYYVSRWNEHPAPFRKGYRVRLHGRFERLDGEVAGWRLEFYVERQVVTDISRGFDPRDSDWSADGQDGMREEFLTRQLGMRFRDAIELDRRAKGGR